MEPSLATDPPATAPSRSRLLWIRPQDAIWVVLFASLILFGPDRNAGSITLLILLGIFQIIEANFEYFTGQRGALVAFAVKLVVCYALIYWTDKVSSSYYWLLLLPAVSAATSLGLLGALTCSVLAGGAYLSFILFLTPEQYIPSEELPVLAIRVIGLPMVAYLTHELAEAKRTEARRYQITAEKLTQANEDLHKAEAAATRSQRLAALGQMAAGLAHELRNPLGTMRTSAEMLLRSVPNDNEVAHEMAGFIVSEVDRTNSLITRFLDFARPLAIQRQKADMGAVLDQAIREVERHQPPFEVTIYRNFSPDVRPFPFDPELTTRVFYNLILNAAQASPPKSTITVKTRRFDGMVEVAVIDRGSGIERKHLENIFNPFFTTKPQGTGLGLAIVSKIIDGHGGRITVESEPGSGTVFRVYFPVTEEQE